MPQNNLVGIYNYIHLYDEDIIDDMQERLDDLVRLVEIGREKT